jgi:SPP1 gp7 family putative phage head morphogenesis protein
LCVCFSQGCSVSVGRFYYDRAIRRLGDDRIIVNRLQNELAQAIILGEGIRQITRRIQDVAGMSYRQARTIARTETLRSLTQGQYLAATQAVDEFGLKLEKTWHTAIDERTRPNHEKVDGKTVDFSEPFRVGDDLMMYPLDPSASAGNIINCRCSFSEKVVGLIGAQAAEREAFVKQMAEERRAERQKQLDIASGSDIIDLGDGVYFAGASGAISRHDTDRMHSHAERFYEQIRKRTTDVEAIAKNTGFSVADVQAVKDHVFMNHHNLGEVIPMRFAPDYDMAVSWQRLISGSNIQEMDIVLLNHELTELRLMSQGLDYVAAHVKADQEYSYIKFIRELDRKEGL